VVASGRTYIKTLFRQIRGNMGRFAAILGIVALGVGFFAGMLATTRDMHASVDAYYDRESTADVFVKATMGITREDVEAVSAMDGIESVMPAYVTDALIYTENEKPLAVRIYGVPLERLEEPSGGAFISRLELVEGRMPASDNECLVHDLGALPTGTKLGTVLTVSPENRGSDSTGDIYLVTEYTVVGTVASPFYFSWEPEPCTVGNGRLDAVIYVNESAYALDVYTDLYLTARDTGELKAFTDEYEAKVEEIGGRLESLGETRSAIRYADILAEARAEIDKAKAEFGDAKAEAEAELADAWAEIEKGKAELDDARRQIEEGKAELADARAELAEETARAREEIERGRRELADALVELENGERRLAEAEQELEDGRLEYNRGYDEYRNGLRQMEEAQAAFDRGEKEYLAGLEQWKAAGEQIAAEEQKLIEAESRLSKAEAEYTEGLAALQEQKTQFDALMSQILSALDASGMPFGSAGELLAALEADPGGPVHAAAGAILSGAGIPATPDDLLTTRQAIAYAEAGLNAAAAEIAAGWAACSVGRHSLEQAKAEHAAAKVQLDAAGAEIERGRRQLDDGWAQLTSAKSTLDDARDRLESGESEIAKARLELDDGWREYHEGVARLTDAEAELAAEVAKAEEDISAAEAELAKAEADYADGLRQLEEGEAEYWQARADVEEELAGAWREILDAEEGLSDIEYPKWYVFDRKSNVSYASFSTNTEKVAAIAKVFPWFFFFVAALVALTTMARMVEEERTQLGTLKALGYPTWAIMSRYVVYCGFATILGCVAGAFLGFKLLPNVIWRVYKTVYRLPPLIAEFRWDLAILSSALALLCTMGATVSACGSALREKPAALMRPRPPKAGKRVFLERIPVIWSRLKFSHKATARNLIRYKRNFFMTVLGVAGCTALLVTGFGLRDSIRDLARTQFDEISKYDLYIGLDGSYGDDPILTEVLSDPTRVDRYVEAFAETGYVMANGKRIETTVMVPMDARELAKVVTLRERRSGREISFSDSSVVLTEKMAGNLGLRPGDTFTIENSDGETGEFVLSDIAEYYAGSYAYVNRDDYSKVFTKDPARNVLMASTRIAGSQEQDEVISTLLTSDSVLGAQFISQIRESLDTVLNSIDLIVVVLIVSSGALAAIVLYNLMNINIEERKKELATLKVLGFHSEEVAAYIFREISILSVIGTVLGFGLGVLLHGFVVRTVEQPDFMFGRDVSPLSMALAGGFTLAFSFLVEVAMSPRLRRIKMVDSMKVIE
jgi:putative ABC transport system permease protein